MPGAGRLDRGGVAEAVQDDIGAVAGEALRRWPRPMPLVEPVTSAVLPFSMIRASKSHRPGAYILHCNTIGTRCARTC